ncbi:MAG: ABC transporter ATP-binding protein [Acidobacteria bacterium]|nr:ABC transporter ATP-binding protein [Acidobacteriota bacterium]
MAEPLLSVGGVSFAYGHLRVLEDVSLDVPDQARVCLLGTNGAGKSTLLNLISGIHQPDRGSIVYDGRDVTKLRPDERVRLGITQIAGGRAIFPTGTVLENLKIGTYPFRKDRGLVNERIEHALDLFPRLRQRVDQKAGTLSGGEQQMVAVARALIARPRLLLADELSLGLAPVLVQEVMGMLGKVLELGTTLLLVEQALSTAFAMTDTAYFMERGAIRFSGGTDELAGREDLLRSVFLGGDRQEAAHAGTIT